MSEAGGPARRRLLRRPLLLACFAVSIGCLALYVLSVPLYSGSSLPFSLRWRFEHGRLTVARSPVAGTESFYVAANSEGLRFAPDAHWRGPGDWLLTVPLWAPMLGAGGLGAWLVLAPRRPR